MVVQEKEDHLKDSMTQMGLLQIAYWSSWLCSDLLVNLLMVLSFMVFGLILQLELFLETSFVGFFAFLYACTFSFTCFAFFVAAFQRKTESARSFGLFFFILTFVSAGIFERFFMSDPDQVGARRMLSMLPPFPLYKGLNDLIQGSSGATAPGFRLSDFSTNNDYYTVFDAVRSLLGSGILYFCLAVYFDAWLPNEYGAKRRPWFCCLPSFWCSRKAAERHSGREVDASTEPSQDEEDLMNADVLAESRALRGKKLPSGEEASLASRKLAVRILGLTKRFTSIKAKCCCINRKKTVFTAVNKLWHGVDEGQLYALLGHNGAGKTTSFNMLTGLMPVTGGDATIFGLSIKDDFGAIRSQMGVCPQHDLLWNQLTGREHLQLFARLKGVPPQQVEEEVTKRLNDVRLTHEEGRSKAGSYSGGMRRRLSIAIALLGDPRIVFLDGFVYFFVPFGGISC